MTKSMFSVLRKVAALVLSLLIIVGGISLRSSFNSSAKDATSDEAVLKQGNTKDTINKLVANDDVKSYDDGEISYFGKGLESLKLRLKPGKDLSDLSKFTFFFNKSGADEKKITSDFTAEKVDDETLQVEYDIVKLMGGTLKEGVYTLTIKFTSDESATETVLTKDFGVCSEPPVINDIKYQVGENVFDNTSEIGFTNQDITVLVSVKGDIIKSVTADDSAMDFDDTLKVYKKTFTSKCAPKIVAENELGEKAERTCDSLKIDKTAPYVDESNISITDTKNNEYDNKWINTKLHVALPVVESDSGISNAKVKVTDSEDNEITFSVKNTADTYTIGFDVNKNDRYVVAFEDNAGNSGRYVFEKNKFKIDTTKPVAEDISITMSGEQSFFAKVFGIYSGKEWTASVNVDKADGSDISEIKLFDGTTELTMDEGVFKISVKDGKYSLFVQVTDEAGNTSEKIDVLNTDGITITANELDVRAFVRSLTDAQKKAFEFVLSKVAPSFKSTTGGVDKAYVKKGDRISIGVSESVAGIKNSKVTVKYGDEVVYSNSAEYGTTKKRATTLTYQVADNLKDGLYTIIFEAESNAGNKNSIEKTFTVDNTAPVFNQNFTYSNTDNTKWSKSPVKVEFELSDLSGVSSVTVQKDGKAVECSGSDGKYSFFAETYGVYSLTAKDVLGNTLTADTDNVLVDMVKPVISKISYQDNADKKWTNKDITITFAVTDNSDEIAGAEVKTVKVNDKNAVYNSETGKYSFVCETYGTYVITAQDVAGNDADYVISETVLIDKTAPTLESVEFSGNNKDYGDYSNEDIIMTLTVNKGSENDDVASLKENGVTVTEADGSAADVVLNEFADGSKYVFKISKSDAVKIHKFRFNVADEAGNSRNYALSSRAVAVSVDYSTADKYEVIATLAKAEINDINIEGTVKDDIYNGDSVRIVSSVNDSKIGLDKVKFYFGKIDINADINTVKPSDLASFDEQAVEKIEPDKNKVESAGIDFSTTSFAEKLESGRYAVIIEAKNNAGNVISKTKDFLVDNSAPEILLTKITSSKLSKYDKNGAYSKSDFTLTVSIDDTKNSIMPSIGVKKAKLNYSDGSLEADVDENGNAVFTLPKRDTAYKNFSVYVEDEYAQSTTKNISEIETKINGVSMELEEGFEIVVSDEDSTITNITSEADGIDKEKVYDNNVEIKCANGNNFYVNGNRAYINSDGTVTAVFKDELCGFNIGASFVSVSQNGGNATKVKENSYPDVLKIEGNDEIKPTVIKMTFDTKKFASQLLKEENGLDDSNYTFYFVPTNKAGVEHRFSSNITVDKTAPVLSKVSFAPVETSETDKFFEMLSFGLYSNNAVEVTLTFSDASPSVGINSSDVVLSSEKGYKVEEGDFNRAGLSYTKKFKIFVGSENANSDYKDLVVRIKDILGNSIKDNSGNDAAYKYHEVSVTGPNGEIDVDEQYDIIVNNDSSNIKLDNEFDKDTENDAVPGDGFKFQGFNAPVKVDGVSYYNDENKKGASISVEISDELSGIKSIRGKITRDGKELDASEGEFGYFEGDGITPLNPAKIKEFTTVAKFTADKFASGEYEIEFIAVNNIGLSATFKNSFCVDNTKPVVKSIRMTRDDGILTEMFRSLGFGLYTNDLLKMELTIEDKSPSSGILDDGITVTSTAGQSITPKNFTDNGDGTYTKSFTFAVGEEFSKSNYKDIIISATDRIGNKESDNYYNYAVNGTYKVYDDTQKPDADYDIVVNNDADSIKLNEEFDKNSDKETISGDGFKFDNFVNYGTNDDGRGLYKDGKNASQNATVTAQFSDTVSGISDITAVITKDGGEPQSIEAVLNRVDGEASEAVDANNLATQKATVVNATVDLSKFGVDTGDYELKFTVVNNIGLSKSFANSFCIDETAPVVKSIEFDPESKSELESLKDFGFYTNKDLKVKVTVSDRVPSSRLDSDGIALSSESGNVVASKNIEENKDFDGKNYIYTKEFTLKTSEGNYKDLKVNLIDKFGNKYSADYYVDENGDIKFRGENTDVDEDYDIVVNDDKDHITIDETIDSSDDKDQIKGDGFLFEGFSHSGKAGGEQIYKDVDAVDGKDTGESNAVIKAEFSDLPSGIRSVKAVLKKTNVGSLELTGTPIEGEFDYTKALSLVAKDSDNNVVDMSDSKAVSVEATVKVSDLYDGGIQSGTYTLTYTITNNAGVKKSFETTFLIDKSCPEIKSITIVPIDDTIFKDFEYGVYGSGDVSLDVEVIDIEGDSLAGPDGDEGFRIKSAGFNYDSGVKLENVSYYSKGDISPKKHGDSKSQVKSFVLKANKTVANFRNLNLSATDAFDNTISFENVLENYPNKIHCNNKVVDFIRYENGASIEKEFILSEGKANISEFELNTDEKYHHVDSDNNDWFSKYFTLDCDISDTFTKLRKIKVFLNGNEISVNNFVTFRDTDKVVPSEFDTITKNAEISINTKELDDKSLPASLKFKQGKNTIKVKVTSNNGLDSSKSFTFYWDTEKPKVKKIEFVENENVEAINGDIIYDSIENESEAESVSKEKDSDYKYFFKDKTTVRVSVSDTISKNETDDKGVVGVKKVILYLVDNDTKEVDKKSKELLTEGSELKYCDFVVDANFKGMLFAKVVDKVNNESPYKAPEGEIVEDYDKFEESTKVKFTINKQSDGTDEYKQPLYKSNVPVRLDVSSTYAGIRRITYWITYSNNGESEKINLTDYTVDKKDHNLKTAVHDTVTISQNANNIRVWVEVEDNAHHSKIFKSKLNNKGTFSIDKTKPKVSLSYKAVNPDGSKGGKYFKNNRTVIITVDERNFDKNKFDIINFKGMNISAASLRWETRGTEFTDSYKHVAEFVCDKDADYSGSFKCTDRAGNVSDTISMEKFTVDKTAPVVSYSYDPPSNGSMYFHDRTATVTITEHNWDGAVINVEAYDKDNKTRKDFKVTNFTTNGDRHTARITFKNGKFRLSVECTDLATNKWDTRKNNESFFIVDSEPGAITIGDGDISTEVIADKAYAGDIAPIVYLNDPNIDLSMCKITITHSVLDKDEMQIKNDVKTIVPTDAESLSDYKVVDIGSIARQSANDGVYRIDVLLVDKVGNKSEKSVTFSVNRFGSTFAYGDSKTAERLTNQRYPNSDNFPDIVIREYNPNPVKQQSVSLTRNDKTWKLVKDKDYSFSSDGSKDKGFIYIYSISAENFKDEGDYTLTVSSVDLFNKKANNRNATLDSSDTKNSRRCPISFVIDKSAPTITVVGVDNNQYYEEAEREVTILCEDPNLDLDYIKVYLDGKEIELSEDSFERSPGSLQTKITLNADGNTDDRELKVVSKDKTGNEGIVEVKPFRLSASWLVRLLHYNLPAIIITAAVIVALIVLIILLKRKKKIKGDKQ